MESWYFSEQSYHPAWDLPGSPKIDAPSAPVDPEVAHRLLHEYLDECRLCDELGINIMVNEHHATHTCMNVSCMLTLATLATITRKVRLLALGIPMLNRMDPLRIAEEIAYVDVLSRGRLEIGLIKGSTFELYVSNAHPVTATKRYWEAHDLVMAALTHTDGPFSWESENFNYRYVNVIPRWPTLAISATNDCCCEPGGRSGAARSEKPMMPVRMLLKSWAIPPASTLRLSSFCACRSWASIIC